MMYMKYALKFVPPVKESTQNASQRELYDRSVELFEQQQYVEALHTLLDHCNPEFRQRYGDSAGLTFRIPHGSIVVDIRIAGDRLDIYADFLKLPATGRVAMLRQVADMNINRLRLPHFVKNGDRLAIAYSCPLAETHPHKIIGVLSNICHVGDHYDDEFCTKFGAERCYEPQVSPYPAETVDRIYAELQSLGKAAQAAVREYNSQRKFRHAWSTLFTFYYQLQYFAAPQGQLSNDLDKICCDMDEEGLFVELVSRGSAYLEKLLATPKETLAADLYFVDTLVSSKRRVSLQQIQEHLTDEFEAATAFMQQSDFDSALVLMTHRFYQACTCCELPDEVNAVITSALRKASEKPVEKAAEILWNAMNNIMEGELIPDIDLAEIVANNPAAQVAVEQAGARVAAMQQAIASEDMQHIQQKMMEAMSKGDMAEYMRLAGEMQQMVMQGMFNNN